MRELTTETFAARDRGPRGVIVERDAEPGSLADASNVPDFPRQPPGDNDTIRPQALFPPVLEASGAEEQLVIKEARQPVSSRLPRGWLVVLLTPLAGVLVAIAVASPRRRE